MKVAIGIHSHTLRQEIGAAWESGETLILAPKGGADESALHLVESARFPEPPVFGVFSSGTLGRKLLLYSRRNIESSLESVLSFFDKERIESIFCYPQPSHVFGLVLGYLASHLYGKRLVFSEGPYSTLAHGLWSKEVSEGMLTLGTPTHFSDLLDWSESCRFVPPHSYTAILGGAPVRRELWVNVQTRLNILAPSVGYGASELSPGATHLSPGQAPIEDFELGRAIPGVNLSIHPAGGVVATGPNVCLAIVQNGVLQFPREVWLRDDVKMRDDGSFVFLKRLDLLLNRGGEKFSIEQIERTIKDRLNIDAIGVGVHHPRLGEELAVVVRSGIASDPASVFQVLEQVFHRQFDPSLYFEIDEIPIGSSAKIDRAGIGRWVRERMGVSHTNRPA